MLTELCSTAGARLSGSPAAEKAVAWAKRTMEAAGLERVRLEPVMVPHWVRGSVEEATLIKAASAEVIPLKVCALGGSIGTPADGLKAGVLEVRSFAELNAAGDKAKGKIIFFNRPFDPTHFEPFLVLRGGGRPACGRSQRRGQGRRRRRTGSLDDLPA